MDDEPLSALWFRDSFLHELTGPPGEHDGWWVDWDRVEEGTCSGACKDDLPWEDRCDCPYMRGILIHHDRSNHVWRLTGERRGEGPDKELFGRWPD
jgi:hypothetical protein